jgi:hypothetical protein
VVLELVLVAEVVAEQVVLAQTTLAIQVVQVELVGQFQLLVLL